jgi:hypothetical protein
VTLSGMKANRGTGNAKIGWCRWYSCGKANNKYRLTWTYGIQWVVFKSYLYKW